MLALIGIAGTAASYLIWDNHNLAEIERRLTPVIQPMSPQSPSNRKDIGKRILDFNANKFMEMLRERTEYHLLEDRSINHNIG